MGMPPEHSKFIQRTGFPIPNTAPLADDERELIGRYGYWLDALAKGLLAPLTAEQQRFVLVAQGEAEPVSAFEVAWQKCRRAADGAPSVVGPLELADRFAQLRSARDAETAIRGEYNTRREAVLEGIRPQLEALEASYADQIAAARDETARLESEIREAVLAFGRSFKHAGVHAVYTRGRVTWDSKGLSRLAESHPEVREFRRVGSPSVRLCFDRPPPQGS